MKKLFVKTAFAAALFCAASFCSPDLSSAWANQKKAAAKASAAKAKASETKKPADKAAGDVAKGDSPAAVIGGAPERGTEVAIPVPPSTATALPEVKGLDAQMVDALAPAPEDAPAESAPAVFPPKSGYIGSQEASRSSEPAPRADEDVAQKLIRLGNPNASSATEDPWGRVAMPTLGILAAIVGLALLWKFMVSRGGGLFASQDKLRVLGQQMIGPRSKVLIVEALGKKYLLGATNEHVSLIADLDFYGEGEDDDASAFAARPQARKSEATSTASGAAPDHDRDAEETADKIKERLKSLKKISK